MTNYQLTEAAQADAENIYAYSIAKFGLRTARTYLNGLHARLQLIAANDALGRDYSHVSPGLLRYEHRGHSVYFQREQNGILVIRILGAAQDPSLHIQDDSEP